MIRFVKSFALVSTAIAAASVAGTAAAAPAALFGNTLEVTGGDGQTSRYLFDAGGAYAKLAPDGAKATGAWSEKDGKLCVAQAAPQAAPEVCVPLGDHAAGDSWTVAGPHGDLKMKLVKGR